MQITINGESIAKEICEQEIQNQKRQHPRLDDEQIKRMAADTIADWTIIRQHANSDIKSVPDALIENEFSRLTQQHGGEEAFRKKFSLEDKDIPNVKKDLEQNLKINQFLQKLTADVPEPSDDDIKRHYESHAEDFTEPASVHAAHIVMRPNPSNPKAAYREMVELRQRLVDGEDFAKLADEHSSCDDNGGDLGWFSPGHMVEEFDTIVFSMQVGEISPVFHTQFGYHIATVYDTKPAELKPLDDVRNEIIDRIKTEKGDNLIGDWVDQQKENAEIEIENA